MSRGPTRVQPGGEPFHVAVAGPVLTEPLAQFLDGPTDPLPEGLGGTPVWQLVRDLASRGQRMSVVTLDHSVSTPVTAKGPLLDLFYGPSRPRHRMRDLMRIERHAVRHGILRSRPDFVHAHWCGEYALGALASGAPTIVTVHDWMPTILRLTRVRYWPHWSGRMLLYFNVLARATHVTANSPYTAHKVQRFTRACLEVVPNGVPDDEFLAAGVHEPGTAGNAVARPVIVSVNDGFGPRKNVGRLLDAHRTLRQRGIECELQLIGEGYGPGGPCESWAREAHYAEGVTYLGSMSRDDVLARMRQATLLAHPSLEESFGMTLVEAMSQHVPVIGGAQSGAVPWVLGRGKAGLLVDVEDPRALSESIEAVLTQEALRARLSREGYVHAWQTFRQSRVTDLYLDAYRRLLADVDAARYGRG